MSECLCFTNNFGSVSKDLSASFAKTIQIIIMTLIINCNVCVVCFVCLLFIVCVQVITDLDSDGCAEEQSSLLVAPGQPGQEVEEGWEH